MFEAECPTDSTFMIYICVYVSVDFILYVGATKDGLGKV